MHDVFSLKRLMHNASIYIELKSHISWYNHWGIGDDNSY